MSELVNRLAEELERPRELSPRVMNYIGGTYSIDEDAVGAFLVEQLPKLEDYEIDLILSPVFTPKLTDQAVFAELLGRESIGRGQWSELIGQLLARPTRGHFVTPDRKTYQVVLREVTLERYVHRLRLEGTISEPVFNRIQEVETAHDRPLLKAIARRAVWENDALGNILSRYLTGAIDRGYSLTDALSLLDLVEGRKPANLADLLARIPGWQETLRQQVDVASRPKPFFHGNIEEMHGGGRDQRQQDDQRISAKEMELEFLGRLKEVLE